ncbi:MAG: AI-2E family transporter [Oscillospiraceae bacterium]|nr:AI-2E family transporter [Oscillospiraceae bacterium]
MKINWDKKYLTITVYACIISAVSVLLVFACINFKYIIDFISRFFRLASPLMYGFIIAYLFNPLMKFCESKFKFIERKKPHKKLKRILSMVITYLLFTIIFVLFIALVVPQIVSSYNDLQAKLVDYFNSTQALIENLAESSALIKTIYDRIIEFVDINKITDSLVEILQGTYVVIQNITPYISNFVINIFGQFINVLLGIIFSIYFLASKEKLNAQIQKTMYAFIKKTNVEKIVEFGKFTDKTFGGFIVGKILESVIVGVVTFVILALINMPYYPLVALIVGVTNVIPFFGPFIGAIPSAFIIFIADPAYTIWFTIIIVVIQQLDGNILGPKILGNKTGLSAMWVIVAIIVMGGLYGIVGMFIGVPIFAVLYAVLKSFAEKRLAKKELPINTEDYKPSEEDHNEDI